MNKYAQDNLNNVVRVNNVEREVSRIIINGITNHGRFKKYHIVTIFLYRMYILFLRP